MVAEAPEHSRQHDLGLRLRPELRAPLHVVRPLDRVLRAETGRVAFLERVDRPAVRCVLRSSDSPEEVARFPSRIDPELPDRIGRRRLIRWLDGNRAATGGAENN